MITRKLFIKNIIVLITVFSVIIFTLYNPLSNYLKIIIISVSLLIIVILEYSNFKITRSNFNRKNELSNLLKSFDEENKKIKNSFNTFKLAFNNIKEGIMVINKSDNKITDANESFGSIISFPGIVNGRFYWEVIRDVSVLNGIEKVLSLNKPTEIEVSSTLTTQTNHYYKIIPSGSFIIVILEDKTLLKKSERIRTDFIANISHELKNPLTAILGFLEILNNEEINESERKKYLQIVYRNVKRLIDLVENLLFLSSIEGGNYISKTSISIKDLINETVELYKNKITEKNIDLIVDISNDLPFIQANEFQLKQVFINLLDNAIKYSSNNDKIIIKVYNERDYVRIDFCDTGVGIPSNEKDRVFERFYKVDKSREKNSNGAGLGLSIVNNILESMNGKIEVQSELGKGSTFSVFIPTNFTQT